MQNKTILIVSHGHPDINKGGGEIAAYNMFKEYLARGYDAYFLARTGELPHGGAAFSTRNSGREILFHTTMDDPFIFSNIKTRHLWKEFKELVEKISPDIVHFHHYFLLGIEMLQVVKETLPQCKILMTLHEFLGICARNGLMITNGQNKLCYKAKHTDCARCFPERSPGDFFLREQYIKNQFDLVDQFISPSQFLKDRYVDWGLDEGKIEVIENGQPVVETLPPAPLTELNKRHRFAYFGQVNPYKGIDLILEAVLAMPRKIRKEIVVDIHGANFDSQSGEYRDHVKAMFEELKGCVKFHGSYEPHEMGTLLKDVDWVIVPSTWWENSPMVIQEAFNHGRPLIVSDIGGMAEKVAHDVNGLHFRTGKSAALMETMLTVMENPKLWDKYYAGIKKPITSSECVEQHLRFFA
ncbi:glycosyltransferase family 4 protein [Vibrio parahaemolyticus]|nr:glycosyltransferase family 4 protein [Vibrio parahaemolyticus]